MIFSKYIRKGDFLMAVFNTADFRLPRWNEYPTVDLYLDQMLSLLNSSIEELMPGCDGNLTRTMINNYVKHKYIKAPVNKRYDRLTCASLLVIALLKPVYSINEISSLIDLDIEHNNVGESYDFFCDLIESAVQSVFEGRSFDRTSSELDPRGILWNVCNSFASWFYVKNIYLQG